MNKIKVIDLLNMISKGEEVPERIQVFSDIFVLDEDNKLYEHEKTRTNLFSIYNGNILNYEAAIIEEDKKIKKLDEYEYDTANEILIIRKINEIIDKINSMEDK